MVEDLRAKAGGDVPGAWRTQRVISAQGSDHERAGLGSAGGGVAAEGRNKIGLLLPGGDCPNCYRSAFVNLMSASNFAEAAPESIDCIAKGSASPRCSPRPAATSAAAAFNNTTSRRADFFPA